MVCRSILDHSTGGLAVASYNCARSVADLGHDVVMLTTVKPSGFHGVEKKDKIEVHYLEGTESGTYGLDFFKRALSCFLKLHAESRFDIVDSHSKAALAFVYDWKRDIPVIQTSHGIGTEYLQNALNLSYISKTLDTAKISRDLSIIYLKDAPLCRGDCELRFFSRFDAFIAISKVVRDETILRNHQSNVYWVPSPVYPSITTRSSTRTNVVALCAANLDNPLKGIPLGLSALTGTPYHIKLIGLGSTPTVNDWARRYNLEGRIDFLGKVPLSQVYRELSTSDIFLDPSTHYSGINTTILSALSVGTPVVGFTTPGILEISDLQYPAGEMVPLGNTQQMRKAIERVYAGQEHYSINAKRLFDSVYHPKASGLARIEVYKKVISGFKP